MQTSAWNAWTDVAQSDPDARTGAGECSVLWLDLRGRVTRWGLASEDIFGHSASEATGLPFWELFDPETVGCDRVVSGLERARTEGGWEEVAWHRRRDGGRFRAASSATLVRTPNGLEIGYMVVTRPIEPLPGENEQRDLPPDAKRLISVGRVAAHLALEVGNILSAVEGFARVLERHMPCDESYEVWRELVTACDRGTRFTRSLLGVGSGSGDEFVDVGDMVRRIEPTLRQVLPERILLVTSLAEGLPPVHGRERDLDLALLNLVINARDAIRGEGTIAITAGLAAGEGGVALTVRDSGVGIAPEAQSKIFDRFFTTKEAGEGTGLGLALVRDVVRGCGGSIDVLSAPGCGTSMRVTLRVAEPGRIADGQARGDMDPMVLSSAPEDHAQFH